MSGKGEGRRMSGNIPLAYDRQQPYTEHPIPTPPAPSAPYPYYDRYPAEEPPTPAFREGYVNEYSQGFWRPEREFFPGTASPERFRSAAVDPWPRPSSWQEPELPAWSERREPVREAYPAPPPPPAPQWTRPATAREGPPTRLFEPSQNWKQSHVGPPPPYPDSFLAARERPVERFPEPVPRDVRERPTERPRMRETYSPLQPTGERFRYSPPPPHSAARNRIPYASARPDAYRPPHRETEWAPEDDDLYADRTEPPPSSLSARSASQDRVDRRFRGRDGFERSVSPASPRHAQHSSPERGSAVAGMTKHESPELPHLEPVPPKPYPSQPVRKPMDSQFNPSRPSNAASRSPSRSSAADKGQTAGKGRLPPKPQPQAQSGHSVSAPAPSRKRPRSPALQISSVTRFSPGLDEDDINPTSQEGVSSSTKATAPTPQTSSQAAAPQRQSKVVGSSELPKQTNKGWKIVGRPTYHSRAPAFVPSTLAIDAKLRFPESPAAGKDKTLQGDSSDTKLPEEGPSNRERDEESDMDMSLPPSPVRSRPSTAHADLDVVSKEKGLREPEEPEHDPALWQPPSPRPTAPTPKGNLPTNDAVGQARVDSEEAEEAGDTSDMEMSPPASPALVPVPAAIDATPSKTPSAAGLGGKAEGEKAEPVRPSLSIDTSVASPQMSRGIPRQRPLIAENTSTPEAVGDESDMEMSSPTSSTPPLPSPTSPYSAPQKTQDGQEPAPQPSSHPQLSRRSPSPPPQQAVPAKPATPPTTSETAGDAVSPGAGTPSTAGPPAVKPPVPSHRDVAVSPLLSHAITPRPLVSISVWEAGKEVPPAAALRLQGVQRTPPAVNRLSVDAGELSPPVSEETLREETETVEKELDTSMLSEKEKDPDVMMHQEKEQGPPRVPETRRVQSTQQEIAQSEKTVTEIPLADALRMIVRLRMMVSSQTEAERIEPILMSNRHIADPEEPVTPAPERLVESVTTKERQRVSEGSYDGTKHSLKKRFAAHKEALKDKVERLRKEYLALHEAWSVHCAKLDEVARANALEEAAATAGRTTRRSAAMGDAVRTDLEMEQILASLGNEELTDANHLSAKNAADIPDMISVTKGRLDYIFDDTNNLVEDPHSFYALETGIDDWTTEEKAIFVEKYAMHPKQFGIIAQFLPNKTPAQCVTFYYLQKNTTIDFRKVVAQYNTVGKRTRRGRGGKQKGNALLADILKHDDEVSRHANQNGTSGRRRRGAPQTSTPTPAPPPESEAGPSTAVQTPTEPPKKAGVSRRSTTQNTPTGTPDPADSEPANNKRPRRRANPTAKAAAAASLGQDPPEEVVDEDARPAKRARRGRKSKAAEVEAAVNTAVEVESASTAPPTETKFIDQTETARKKSSGAGAVWSDEDKAQFLDLLSRHGHDFKRIAASMPNKTTIQVTSFYKANHIEMELANVAAKAPKRSSSPTASTSTAPEPTAKPATPPAKTSALPANPEDMPLDADTLNSLRAFLARTSGAPQGSASHGSLPTAPGAGFPSHAKADSPNQLPPTAPHSRKPRAGRGGGRGRAAQAPLPALFTTVPRGAVDPENAEAPDRLETVGDLYRWLEHRTRLNAEQNNDSGFM